EGGLAQNPVRLAASYAAIAIAFHDAHIACWDAKYAYWYIRPSQADTAITTLVPLPPHPSYPSAHSCLSNGPATVLARLFPADAEHFRTLTQAAGEARIAAGLHYRYDITAGEEIGRRAAELTLERLAPALRGD
ncbi:MAG: phosphatase PAP2 family protein, partial [Pseudomonadota bacterium]